VNDSRLDLRPVNPLHLVLLARMGLACILLVTLAARGRARGMDLGSVIEHSALAAAAVASPRAPEFAAPRLLRALPGLGVGRARTVADARWRAGGHLPLASWGSLRGIGPVTLKTLRALDR